MTKTEINERVKGLLSEEIPATGLGYEAALWEIAAQLADMNERGVVVINEGK